MATSNLVLHACMGRNCGYKGNSPQMYVLMGFGSNDSIWSDRVTVWLDVEPNSNPNRWGLRSSGMQHVDTSSQYA